MQIDQCELPYKNKEYNHIIISIDAEKHLTGYSTHIWLQHLFSYITTWSDHSGISKINLYFPQENYITESIWCGFSSLYHLLYDFIVCNICLLFCIYPEPLYPSVASSILASSWKLPQRHYLLPKLQYSLYSQ